MIVNLVDDFRLPGYFFYAFFEMESGFSDRLVGSEIHGFHTLRGTDFFLYFGSNFSNWKLAAKGMAWYTLEKVFFFFSYYRFGEQKHAVILYVFGLLCSFAFLILSGLVFAL